MSKVTITIGAVDAGQIYFSKHINTSCWKNINKIMGIIMEQLQVVVTVAFSQIIRIYSLESFGRWDWLGLELQVFGC